MKKEFKELQKGLSKTFIKQGSNYDLAGGVGLWLIQSGIKPTGIHLTIICTIFGSVPYPYQKQDRCDIIEYLNNAKYKHFIAMHDFKQKVLAESIERDRKKRMGSWLPEQEGRNNG